MMNNREQYDFYTQNGLISQSKEERVKHLVNLLIDALFIPNEERLQHMDIVRVRHFGIDETEPINWGDLKCVEVKEFVDGTFLVTIDEACPNECTTLCEYIEKYMAAWGWGVEAQTEW